MFITDSFLNPWTTVNDDRYSEILKEATNALSRITEDIKIVGDGPSRFLHASRGQFALEFYAGDNQFIIDPAIHRELQGEQMFRTMEEAIKYASAWLTQKQ